jgi:hypothetical protein
MGAEGGWGDVSFMMEQGQYIEKMAIVGDEKWRDDALAFTAKRIFAPPPSSYGVTHE